MLQELLAKKAKLEKGIDNPNINAEQRIAMKDKLQEIDAQIAELESPKATGKASKPKAEPKAKKEQEKVEEVITTTPSPAEQDERLERKFGKNADVVSCEGVLEKWRADKKKHDQNYKEQNLIERVMRSKEHKGKHTKAELEDKTIPELREMLGLAKKPQQEMEAQVEKTFENYARKRLAVVLKDESPESLKDKKQAIEELQKDYANKIAESFAKYRVEFLNKVKAL